jgi:hypothetical protein
VEKRPKQSPEDNKVTDLDEERRKRRVGKSILDTHDSMPAGPFGPEIRVEKPKSKKDK